MFSLLRVSCPVTTVCGWIKRHASLRGQQDKQTHNGRAVVGEQQHKSEPAAAKGDGHNLKHSHFVMGFFFFLNKYYLNY